MILTSLQQTAIDAWKAGKNVRIMAVPGAGKSRVLIEACLSCDSPCVILAYNRELCQQTKEKLAAVGLSDRVMCMTFHGLATYCVAPTHDDVALADVLERLDSGAQAARRLTGIGKVLIDEAQDFRPSFLRLIRHLIQMDEDTQYMPVGDLRQMLYDYSDDDPASLEYLQRPEAFFVSSREWASVALDETHRMTPEMTYIVSRMFDVTVRSVKPPSRAVEVYTINQWCAGPLLADLLRGEDLQACCVLVPFKKNNGPLRATVNHLSRRGVRLFIHGIDGQDPRIKRNKLSISTWHASKGTQKRVCVVLGLTNDAATNPSFVALTRGEARLIVIQDVQSPHRGLLRTLVDAPSGIVVMDETTKDLVGRVDSLPPDASRSWKSDLVCVDAWRPSGSGRWMCNLMTVDVPDSEAPSEDDDEDEIVAGLVGDHEDVADVYRVACLMAAERRVSGRIRRLTEIRMPMRMTRDSQNVALKSGSHVRFVSSNASENSLLEATHRQRVLQIDSKTDVTTEEWCFLSCATRAWNSYHHTLRQLHPFDWMDAARFENGVDYIMHLLEHAGDVEFDVRLRAECQGQTLHGRCDVSSVGAAYMFVWQAMITHGHRMEGGIVAALHESGICILVNLRSEATQCVNVQGHRETILKQLVRL